MRTILSLTVTIEINNKSPEFDITKWVNVFDNKLREIKFGEVDVINCEKVVVIE